MLTELQKERISFHLDYVAARYLLAITRDNLILTLNTSQQLSLVGPDEEDVPLDNKLDFEGIYLCSKTSMLGKVELAFSKLSPDTIEESLYVSSAGTVTLRGNELSKREALYLSMVSYLNQLVGGSKHNKRVGRNG